MIMKDRVTDLILKMDLFMTKKGQDLTVRRDLIRAINGITEEDALDTIYVNNIENFNIPDVVVLPLYNRDFNLFVMDGDLANTCPFGYTLEIHERCFTKYTAEELTAVVLHDILQNVQSSVAKVRFIKAYNHAISKYQTDDLLSLFDDISSSEVMFMAYMDICTRPFRVPCSGYDYMGTDEVLVTMGLADAYDSYLEKILPMSTDTVEQRIERTTKEDYRTLRTVLSACMDKDIRHYYAMVRNGVPLVTLEHIFGSSSTVASLGFISHKRDFKRRYIPSHDANSNAAITESFIRPKNEIDLRFQIDKIISEMRYAETEAEREVILYKIKNLSLQLSKNAQKLEEKVKRNPQDESAKRQLEAILNFLDELEMLRDKTVKMDIKQMRYGVFCKVPVEGYDY